MIYVKKKHVSYKIEIKKAPVNRYKASIYPGSKLEFQSDGGLWGS